MPYIPILERWNREAVANTAGELNYDITQIVIGYFNSHRNYQGINDILGALEGAKLEFYRRIAVPYEQEKMAQNGDVYT